MQGAQILRNEAYFSYAAMTKDEVQHSRMTFYKAATINYFFEYFLIKALISEIIASAGRPFALASVTHLSFIG